MGNCQDCKYWEGKALAWGIEEGSGFGRCRAVGDNDSSSKAFIFTSEDADLITRPDFGCVQFEAKECAA